MNGTSVARILSLPLCLLALGTLKTAVAQSCPDATCVISAINAANANTKKTTINLVGAQTYLLGASLPPLFPIEISGNVSIVGDGNTLDGTGLSAIFLVDAGATLEFDDVTLTNATGAGLFNNGGKITLNSSTVSFCAGFYPLGGGGIFNAAGTVTLNNSTVSNNTTPVVVTSQGTSTTSGGGILNQDTVTLNSSVISGNSATGAQGGGVYNSGQLTLNKSTVTGNGTPAAQGGGIFNDTTGTVTLNSSTVTGNTATSGAGIYNLGGTLTLNKSNVDSIAP
jgi:hypothetical protein